MVLKSSTVLSCLLPARFGFGSNHRPDPPSHTRDQQKHAKDKPVPNGSLGDPEGDHFRGNAFPLYRATEPAPHTHHPDLPRARANTAPSDLLCPPLMPDGGIGESPNPLHRPLASPVRQKRSSFTTFFAFSSKRRSSHGAPVIHFPPQSAQGRWVSGSDQSQVHIINPTTIPSPLRVDDEEYYYSYYASLGPTSHPTSPDPDATNRSPSKQLFFRQQDLTGNPDLDSQPSSPVGSHLSNTQIRHPYAYSTPLDSKPYPKFVDAGPRLRHVSSQPFQHHPQGSSSGIDAGLEPSSQPGPHPLHPELKSSMSTPNLISGVPPVRPRSLLRKKSRSSTRPKGQERWLSAETWWDALFSPSPRFKVRRAPRPRATDAISSTPVEKPVQAQPNENLGVTFPSIQTARPRAVSVTSTTTNTRTTVHSLARSRSAVDLSGRAPTSATSRTGFEPALEPLVDQPTPPPEQPPGNDTELPLPDPYVSLEQVLDEGEAFEHQRAQWKQQAYNSLGNKHTRSFSRARSKSLGERHARFGRHASENSKAQLNIEFLAARTFLGSQSTMPVVHVTKPSNSSSHSKSYSHSHSQSAHSRTHSSHSRAYSHSHSLTTSNSSKSSRHFPPRGHSRNGSWSKTALLKAGALCGIVQDDSRTTDENVPSSSRVDVQGTIVIGPSTNAEQPSPDVDKVSPSPSVPSREVGIAISSSPAPDGSFNLRPSHQEGDQEKRWPSKHTHKPSGYAGPHPSAIDSNLPRLGTSDVSMRHRLPPRAAIHPPIAPIAHPYRSVVAQPGRVGNMESPAASSKVAEAQETVGPGTGRNPYLSLSHADFEQYGVGEALVYASFPRSEEVPETKQGDVQDESSPTAELLSSREQSPLCETTVLRCQGRDSSSLAINSAPSLTNSTIQMVMSAFNDPDELDEFQDLFYKPHPACEAQRRELTVAINQVPTDVHSSTSSSPLTHLMRKLSEEVHSMRNPSRTPSDPILIQKTESQDHLNEGGTNFVFMDVARSSSSPPPMESSSQLQLPIQEGGESTAQPIMVIPEDINSSCTSSVLESPLEDQENDTFGYPVKHGRLDVATAPAPIQSPMRASTHLSIQEDETDEGEVAFSGPVTKRYGLVSVDAVRASYLTTSDLSQMSGLSDFPLPPGARPVSIMHAYDEVTLPSSSSESRGPSDEGTEVGHGGRYMDGEDGEPSSDVEETLRALRTTLCVTSYESRRSTFGGSDDMDFTTQLHQPGP